jgi:hypothetical protein
LGIAVPDELADMRSTAKIANSSFSMDSNNIKQEIFVTKPGMHKEVGSHRQYKHRTKPGKVTVAGHPSSDLPPKTLKSILRQAGLEN